MEEPGSEDVLNNFEWEGFSMTEIYYLLLSDLSNVSDLVDNAKIHAVENQPTKPWGSFVRNLKRNQNNADDLQSMFKKKILDSVCKNVEDLKPFGEPLYTGNLSLELKNKLLQRVKADRQCIQQLTTEVTQLRNFNKELERKAAELERVVTLRTESGEMVTKVDWKEIEKKIKHQRQKLVKDVRYITDQLCPDSDVDIILSNALKAAFNNTDPYINSDEFSVDDVEFLLRCKLISRNPHDRKLVRLLGLQ